MSSASSPIRPARARKSFAALLPANAYGSVVEASFRGAVATAGGRIVAIETLQPSDADAQAKAARIAAIAPQIDALLIPDGGEAVPAIAAALAAGGVTRDKREASRLRPVGRRAAS